MITIRSLDLSAVDQLGPRARRCAYWQTDDRDGDTIPGDPGFEKEAWISHVSLEWGVCGQVARNGNDSAGAAFYAPPGMAPRSVCFPTSPVGADAILLAGMNVENGAPAGVLTALLDAVVVDLRSRGIRAIEAFGQVSGDTGDVLSRDGCGADSCVPGKDFLVEHGFTVVADHETHPRLRLDIDSEHMWKADVEHALDQLFAERGFPTRRLAELSGVTAKFDRPGGI